MVVEELLKFFICKVDAKLLKTVILLEGKNKIIQLMTQTRIQRPGKLKM